MSKYRFFRRHPGEGTPMILAIVLVLLILFCTVAEFSRVWIIAQGVKEAAQQAVISTINDNYDHCFSPLSLRANRAYAPISFVFHRGSYKTRKYARNAMYRIV